MSIESSKNKCDKVKQLVQSIGRETWLTSWELIRITIPVAIATKVFEELGLISFLSIVLTPVMDILGLPGALGLVWATAMLTNIYGGIAVFTALLPGLTLTSAQVTVLCSVILIAHSLPIELSVSKRAGAEVLPIALIRLLGAVVYGFLLNRLCLAFDIWQQPAVLLFKVTAKSGDLLPWVIDLLRNLGLIVGAIFLIIICMRLFRAVGFLGLMEKILAPVLPFFGMSHQAAPITVVGMIMGIGYGGALIIRETSTGKLTKEEVFNSMALMGLCHGLVEDTLILAAIGGKFGGILWGRIIFSLLVSFLLVRGVRFLTDRRIRQGV
jgi:spore maturation protein SpmB